MREATHSGSAETANLTFKHITPFQNQEDHARPKGTDEPDCHGRSDRHLRYPSCSYARSSAPCVAPRGFWNKTGSRAPAGSSAGTHCNCRPAERLRSIARATRGLPVESALQVQKEMTELDRYIDPQESNHPNQSGFHLIREGPEAFVTRLQSARLAGRTLDVQTYIWHNDTTGMYLVKELLKAADRGVRVRLLVDDMDARSKNLGLAGLAAHPNISVRLFNPYASRQGKVALESGKAWAASNASIIECTTKPGSLITAWRWPAAGISVMNISAQATR